MSNDASEYQFLNKLYAQIVNGFSECKWNSRKLYIRHFGVAEQFQIQQKYDEVFAKASDEGLPTEEETLKLLKEEGSWSAEEEKEITDKESYVQGLRQSRKHLIIPSQIEQLSKQLEVAEKELIELKIVKDSLLKNTCEAFADHRSNDYSVYLSFCQNITLDNLFTSEEFDELDKVELNDLVMIYNKTMNDLNTYNIQKIAIAPFFVNYFNITGDSPYSFFEGPVSKLSYYQVNLLNYGRVFKSIFENVPDIPDHVMEDPEKILDYAESSKKTEKTRDRAQQADGYSVVGATEGDLKTMGLKDGTTKSIFDLAREKGGNLDITDFK